MAQLKDLIVTGASRFLGDIYGNLKGNADSATKLTTSAGSATQPIYFNDGKPAATTYTLGKSVPSDAKFTDTTYTAGTGLSLSGTKFNHSNSVTAGTAQGDANKTLSFGGTFTIPTVTYDAQGHITGKGTTTMTMPANPNVDTKVTQAAAITTAGEYPVILGYNTATTAVTNTVNKTSTLTYNPSTKVLTATTFKGALSGNASSASKVNNKLTVGSKTYDGSAAVTIAASDLGLASAMLFLGTTTTAITDGATTNPITISGTSKTVTAGNVVLYGNQEFVWTGSIWELLGDEGSYKVKQTAVADPSASGTSNSFIATISQDANGKITATKKTVAVTNSAPTLSWGTTSTIGTVAGTNLQVKMPANPNTDTKVTQTVTTSNAAYPLLLAPNGQTATTTTSAYFNSGVTLNPSTNTIAANISGNAATATKLATARTIALGTGASGTATSFDGSSNITIPVTEIKESYLSWGGKDFSGNYGPIDAAMIDVLGANRLAYGKAAGITIEYSRNGGSTWTDYGATDVQKVSLFSPVGQSFLIGKADSTNKATGQYMLRVTISSKAFGVYTQLNKFAIYVSTNGSSGCYCTIDVATHGNPTSFATLKNKVNISGWTGWNIINTDNITTYGSRDDQYEKIRFTFGCTSGSTNYNGLQVQQIRGFGGVGWSTPSNMAATGHIYALDAAQNVTFPASITVYNGNFFRGNLSGNASTATKLETARTLKVNLTSTNASTAFNGSANITDIGVAGTLAVANGGTGRTSLVTPTVTWTAGSTSGPTLTIKDSLDKSSSAVAIPVASKTASGVITTDAQTFAGAKYTTGNHMGFVSSGERDKFFDFAYTEDPTAPGASWRIGSLNSGSADANYFVIQTGGSDTAATTWINAIRIGMNTRDIAVGGNLYPSIDNAKTLGTSSYKWSNIYATKVNDYTLAAACAKAVTDSSSASAIGTGTSLPTERDIYYGLPTINNSHSYTSSTTIYAPSAGGTAGQYLKAAGATSMPTWTSFAALTVKSKNIANKEATKATYTPATAATATIGPDDLFEIYSYSVTKALSLNTWTDVATAANLGSPATGTYIIQVTAGSAVYSGVMTWDATTTAVSGLYDEILLHSASTSTAHVTARVNRDSSLRLQLCAIDAAVASGTITVKMRRMI